MLEGKEVIRVDGRKLGFNMRIWHSYVPTVDWEGHKCGTVACIGGTQEILVPGQLSQNSLGLAEEQALALFTPGDAITKGWPDWATWGSVSNVHAARVVRHLIRTGEVDWSAAKFKEPA